MRCSQNLRLKLYGVAVLVCALIGCGGQLRPQSGTPSGTQPGTPPAPLHFLYSINCCQGPFAVYGFGEDSTGAVTPLQGSPFAINPSPGNGFTASGLTADPQGRFLLVPQRDSSSCCHFVSSAGYSIDSKTGAVSATPTTGSGGGPIAFHPSGRFLYSASPSGFPMPLCFGIGGQDLSTNQPIPGSPFSSGSCIQALSVDPAGRYLYVIINNSFIIPLPSSFFIATIDTNTGILTFPFPPIPTTGKQPNGQILFHPSGKFGYGLGIPPESSTVDLYSVDATTGALTFLSTQINNQLLNPIMSPGGNFLYGCLTSTNPCAVAYRVDNNTGALKPISGFNLGAGLGNTLVLDKSGKYAYALSASSTQSSSQILVYSVDSSTGVLTQIPSLTTTVPAGLVNIVAGP